MSWTGVAPSQTFARTNGVNNGATTWAQDAAASTNILSTRHDTHDQDISDGVNACLKKDGGNTATANIPMGGFTLTNVGSPTATTMPARVSDLQSGRGTYCTVGGTANAITLTNSVPITAYAAGQKFKFFITSSNTSSVTVAVDGLTATAVKVAGVDLSAGQFAAGAYMEIAHDGTDFEAIVGSVPATVSVGAVMAWPLATVPTGWLEADGSAVSRTTYSALFAIYSTSYGVGDGSTTFNLPNYKDYFLRGFDASGTDAASRTDRGDGTTGASVGTKQASDYLAHTHTGTTASESAHTHTVTQEVMTNGFSSGLNGATANDSFIMDSGTSEVGTSTQPNPTTTSAGSAHAHTFTTAASPTSGGTETRPKNITVKWIILALPGASVSTAQVAPYFTALSSDFTGTDVSTAQPVFDTGQDAITLPASTSYAFEALYYITRAAGSTSHDTSVLFGGTATFTSIMYAIESTTTTGAPTATTASQQLVAAAATAVVAATTSTSTTENIVIKLKGIMRVNGSGTVIPQFKYSAAPGGVPTVKANSFFMLTPIGANTVTSYGPWG